MNQNPSSDKDNPSAAIPVWIAGNVPQGAVTFQYSASLATAGAVQVSAAGTGTQQNHVTGVQFFNTTATPQTIEILDGATIMWQVTVGANATIAINLFLTGSPATALNVNNVTGTGAVDVNIQGYLY